MHDRLSPGPVIEMSVGARLKAAGDSLACVGVAGEERRGEERREAGRIWEESDEVEVKIACRDVKASWGL